MLDTPAFSDREEKWIIDTGATNHMVCSITHFTTITAIVNTTVKLHNGDIALVTHTGMVKLSKTLTLTNVLMYSFSQM